MSGSTLGAVEVYAPVQRPNWFGRHLNIIVLVAWAQFLAFAAVYYAINDPGDFTQLTPYGRMASRFLGSPETGLEILYWVFLAEVVTVSGWALKQKSRSLWNLLWYFVPFGLFVFLFIDHKRERD